MSNSYESHLGIDLYFKVRAGFIAQGKSLTAWCRANGLKTSNARASLTGSWNGPKSKRLRIKMIEASGISLPLSEKSIEID